MPEIGKIYPFPDAIIKPIDDAITEILCTINTLKARGVTEIRLGISWYDWVCMPGGRAWISWYVREYGKHFKVFPWLTFTSQPFANDNARTTDTRQLEDSFDDGFTEELYAELGDYLEGVP